LIRIKDFSFFYADSPKPALENINLTINDGEFVIITGPSGGGKSSLCRCINGLIPHFYGGKISGRVEINGLDTIQHKTSELATHVGMVFQDPENQLITTDVEREIAFGLENMSFPHDSINRKIEESLDAVGIPHLRQKQISELSGGEKQRVAIASVLALHPRILILDEPTSELDPKGAEEVLNVIKRLNEELGITIILIEHRMDRVIHHSDRMIVITNGHIITDENPRLVLSNGHWEQAGIGIPPIIQLTHKLKEKGFNISKIPLTVKESRIILGNIFQEIIPRLKTDNNHQTNYQKGKPVIEITKLYYTYPEGITALNNINLTIHSGEFVAIMGRNASGKTTLARHINGLLQPTHGEVIINGVNTNKKTVAQLAQSVGFLFQNPNQHLFADTVEDELLLTLNNTNMAQNKKELRITETLGMLGILHLRHSYPRSLSGGEKQRVALASVIAAQPDILVLDEPTRGMEQRRKDELMTFLEEYRNKGNTIIVISHDVETIARYSDRVILMSNGHIVADGNKHDILSGSLFFSPQINRLLQTFPQYNKIQDILTVEEIMEYLP